MLDIIVYAVFRQVDLNKRYSPYITLTLALESQSSRL